MHTVDFCILLYVLLQAAVTAGEIHPQNEEVAPQRKRPVVDPVSNFLSQLGGLFLDIDEAVAVQTAPKVRFEDTIAQVLRPLVPSTGYFDRIKENYQNLQRRLGLLNDPIVPRNARKLPSTDSPKFMSLPKKDKSTKFPHVPKRMRQDVVLFMENQSLDNDKTSGKNPFDDSNQRNDLKESDVGRSEELQNVVNGLLKDARRANDLIATLGARTLNELGSTFSARRGDISEFDSNLNDEEIDIEPSYDNYVASLLRNQAKWFLNNPILNRFRGNSRQISSESTTDASSVVENTVPTVTEFTTEYGIPTSSESDESYDGSRIVFDNEDNAILPDAAANYYNVDSGEIDNDINLIYNTEYRRKVYDEVDEMNKLVKHEDQNQDTVILAFSPDGVPLKLRMSGDIENPIKYLHRALKSAGVCLNIPVQSYEDLEPIGKEILQLGDGTGTMTRAVYLDISNEDELKSLLRTLVKTKFQRGKVSYF